MTSAADGAAAAEARKEDLLLDIEDFKLDFQESDLQMAPQGSAGQSPNLNNEALAIAKFLS